MIILIQNEYSILLTWKTQKLPNIEPSILHDKLQSWARAGWHHRLVVGSVSFLEEAHEDGHLGARHVGAKFSTTENNDGGLFSDGQNNDVSREEGGRYLEEQVVDILAHP